MPKFIQRNLALLAATDAQNVAERLLDSLIFSLGLKGFSLPLYVGKSRPILAIKLVPELNDLLLRLLPVRLAERFL